MYILKNSLQYCILFSMFWQICDTSFFILKVSMAKKLHEMGGIDGILEEVRSVINDGMDIVDMAEECLDEPYAH